MTAIKRRFFLCCGVAALALLSVRQAYPASFIIDGSNSPAEEQVLVDPGDVGIVRPDGVIDISGKPGLTAAIGASTASGVTVDNAGTILAVDDNQTNLVAVWLDNSNTIVNSGDITSVTGIIVRNDNTITNAGNITTFLDSLFIWDGNSVTNTGDISAVDLAVRIFGDHNLVRNSGRIAGSSAIEAWGDYNTIINSGEMVGFVGLIGGNNTFVNSGISNDIFALSDNTITNSGKIVGERFAVVFGGANSTLRLLEGSNVQGELNLGGSSNTLIIGRGLDTALAFEGTPTIKTDDVPFVVIDNTVYAVNVTGFSVQDEMANDLTRAVTGAVEGRLATARHLGGGLSMAMNGMTIAAAADVSVGPQNGIWLSGLAAWRDQEEDGNVAAFETMLGGVLGGFDAMVTDTTRAGLFGGFSSASLDAEDDALEDLDSDNWFGGVYLGHDWGQAFLDLTLTAGWSEFDSRRRVANNMVPGGIEYAEADYGGLLLSPSLRIGTNMEMASGVLTPSLRLRYAGLFLEDYEESGSAAALEVDERAISVFDVRGELAYGFATGSLQNTLRIGIDGTLSNADRAEATLAGQALDIDVAEEALARGFVGYDADYALSDSASLTLSTEAGYDTAEALTLEARAGFSWAF